MPTKLTLKKPVQYYSVAVVFKGTIRKMHTPWKGKLILREINENGATGCQILRLKCTKFDFTTLKISHLYSGGLFLKGGRGTGFRHPGTYPKNGGFFGCTHLKNPANKTHQKTHLN